MNYCLDDGASCLKKETMRKWTLHRVMWETNDIRSALHGYKLVFQLPSLFRRIPDKCPHGSYRNRGAYARFMRNRGYKKGKKKQWTEKKVVQGEA
jgi:hypothetical protein